MDSCWQITWDKSSSKCLSILLEDSGTATHPPLTKSGWRQPRLPLLDLIWILLVSRLCITLLPYFNNLVCLLTLSLSLQSFWAFHPSFSAFFFIPLIWEIKLLKLNSLFCRDLLGQSGKLLLISSTFVCWIAILRSVASELVVEVQSNRSGVRKEESKGRVDGISSCNQSTYSVLMDSSFSLFLRPPEPLPWISLIRDIHVYNGLALSSLLRDPTLLHHHHPVSLHIHNIKHKMLTGDTYSWLHEHVRCCGRFETEHALVGERSLKEMRVWRKRRRCVSYLYTAKETFYL